MITVDEKIDSFSYDSLIADCIKAISEKVEAKKVEVVAMVAYENTYESKEADADLDVDSLTYDVFLSSMVESANLIITHKLF